MENGLFMAPLIYHLEVLYIHSSIHRLTAEPNSQRATLIGHMTGDCSLAMHMQGCWDQTNDPRFSPLHQLSSMEIE